MASSTTVPMASTKANNVNRFNVKPAICRAAKVPTSETMMEMAGMSVARKSCKKKYTTISTRRRAIKSVSSTLAIDSRRKSLVDNICSKCRPLGIDLLISSSAAVRRSLVSLALAPAIWKAMKMTDGLPSTIPL